MTCFVAVGCKLGDCVNALPLVHHWAITNGEKPTLMVAKQYASILNRVSYVEPLVFDGNWIDLKPALSLAKQKFNHVVCLGVFGKDFPVEHRTTSFMLEPYERMGWLPLYGTLPLVINYTERKPFQKPTILYADHSQSSPFLYKQRLLELLKNNFPKHQVLLLSDVLLPHFADFVGWYDKADALVSVETAHMHLSAATRTPTFALATDKPHKWNGSAWSKRFKFFCRYGEFEQRQEELIEAIKCTLAGIKKPEILCLN